MAANLPDRPDAPARSDPGHESARRKRSCGAGRRCRGRPRWRPPAPRQRAQRRRIARRPAATLLPDAPLRSISLLRASRRRLQRTLRGDIGSPRERFAIRAGPNRNHCYGDDPALRRLTAPACTLPRVRRQPRRKPRDWDGDAAQLRGTWCEARAIRQTPGEAPPPQYLSPDGAAARSVRMKRGWG